MIDLPIDLKQFFFKFITKIHLKVEQVKEQNPRQSLLFFHFLSSLQLKSIYFGTKNDDHQFYCHFQILHLMTNK
jgi:hypothetical protein